MNKIPKCHICGMPKCLLDGRVVCPFAHKHDQKPQLIKEHSVDRTMVIVGLTFQYGDYRK